MLQASNISTFLTLFTDCMSLILIFPLKHKYYSVSAEYECDCLDVTILLLKDKANELSVKYLRKLKVFNVGYWILTKR
jgi:hypothetical protein